MVFDKNMKISIVSGESEGPSPLNAFDNALLKAGIGDVNLIKVSSMLAGNTCIVDLPYLEPGSMVNCVLSEITSTTPGDKITACVCVAIGEQLGCVSEYSSVEESEETVKSKCREMTQYMMDVRGVEIKELISESSTHIVEKCGSSIVSVVYNK